MFKSVIVVLFCVSRFAAADEITMVTWPNAKSAVAWKTKKRMFLVQQVEPIGINSDITVTKDLKNKKIVVAVPINRFDSGEPERDKEVLKILKANIQPDLVFTSDVISIEQEAAIKHNQYSGSLSGELKIGGKPYKINLTINHSNIGPQEWLDGELHTTFSAFEISPPTVAGGFVAKVQDDLTLLFHINLADIITNP